MKKDIFAIFILIVFITELGLLCFPGAASSQVLMVQTYNEIPFITGGIGFDERKEFRRVRSDYSLRLVFSVKSGAYLSDVEVQIQDNNNIKVFEGISDGPLFYVNFPAGSYTVMATMLGKSMKKKVTIESEKNKQVTFSW